MNWKKLLLNLGAAAAGGFSSAIAAAPGGVTPTKGAIAGAILTTILANVVGLFQQPPHQDA